MSGQCHPPATQFLPTATIETLQQRARLIASIRAFFVENGYWECETPILSGEVVIDANLDPFVTHNSNGKTLYLQTSPEAGMKRLLAAGADAIFQITRTFRRDESGQLHNPEFTMLEWYRGGDDHHAQMDFVEKLMRCVCPQTSSEPFERLTYDEAFERFAGRRVLHLDASQLKQLAAERNVAVPDGMSTDDRDPWLNLLLAELVEPHLGKEAPQFVYDYPASQAALATVRSSTDNQPPVAERFELYDRGIEICNGYHELTDPDELSRREAEERRRSTSTTIQNFPEPSLLKDAMRYGLPDCSGVALGLDRLIMLTLGCEQISEVLAFPIDRA